MHALVRARMRSALVTNIAKRLIAKKGAKCGSDLFIKLGVSDVFSRRLGARVQLCRNDVHSLGLQ